MGIFLIARDNIKKKKANALILFLLVALSVLLLYTGISVLSNMVQVIDNQNESINGADYLLFTPSTEIDQIDTLLKGREEVAECENESAIMLTGTKYYSGGENEEDAQQLAFLFMDKDAKRNISKLKVIDEGSEWKENSIIAPYYMKVGMGYKTGDILNLIYKDSTYSFEIYGFSEDVMFSTPSNVPMEKCFISKAYFEKYTDSWGGKATIFRALLKDGYDKEKFEVDALQMLTEQVKDFQFMNNFTVNYTTMRSGATITANILMAVLTVFAVLLILIALIILFFNVNNSIESNMKNIGMLEASGYTSRQLATSTIYEFLMISIAGIIAGFLGATAATKTIGALLSASIGLSWKMDFDTGSAFISTIITIMLILLAAVVSSHKYKKIAPLDALRNGINTHNFKKNHIRMEEVGLPLNISIGLKNILYNKKKTVIICLIVVVLSFCANVTVSVYTNFVLQNDTLIQLSGIETHEITVEATENTTEGLTDFLNKSKQEISSMKGIRQILEFTNTDVKLRNGENDISVNCDIYDDMSNLSTDNLIEGKRPEYDNEIMVTSVILDRLDAELGDVIYLEANGNSKDFLVVGIGQGITNLGRKAVITKEGMKRLNEDFVPMALYIYLEEGTEVKGAIAEIESRLSDQKVEVYDFRDYLSAATSSISSAMSSMCLVLLITVILVIAMLLLLLIKTQLVRDKKLFGIYKALGYTTWQLIMQTTMSYLPVVLIGAILGSVVAWFGIEPSITACISAFGIKNCNMRVVPLDMLCAVAMICIWAELIAVLCSAQIRKIVPCEMIQEV